MQRSIAPLLSSLALLFAAAAPLGCYKPNIKDGGLRCNMDAGAKQCPEGFKCDPATKFCWRNPDGGPDRRDGGGIDADAGPDVVCFDAKPGCAPGTGMCDPACQTGCLCGEKCSVNSMSALTCNPPRKQDFPKGVGQSCTIESLGLADQTDNCGPGLVCVEDGCFRRCFQFCNKDGDCTDSACTRDVGGGQKVCDVPFVDDCVPLAANSGCAGGAMTCYISSGSPTHTICDCPMNARGPNEDCTKSRDCFPGLVCVPQASGDSPKCWQVCRLSLNGSDCPLPSTPGSCHQYFGIPPGPAAHPTFGYCL